MQITDVKVFPIDEEKLKAFVSVVFDSCFMVNDIKVIAGRDGLFISMPSRKKKNGEFKDVAHPLNNQTRQRMEAAILGEYERVLAERAGARPRGVVTPPAESVDAGRVAPVLGEVVPPGGGSPPPAATSARRQPRSVREPRARAVEGRDVASVSPLEERQEAGEEKDASKTLEEVEEAHLRDSFWSMG